MICNTENCTTPATHTDWKDEPICTECVENAVEFGEKAGSFKIIEPDQKKSEEVAKIYQNFGTEAGAKIIEDIESMNSPAPATATDAAEIIKDLGLDHIAPTSQTPISDAAIEILSGDDENTQEAMDEYLKLSTPATTCTYDEKTFCSCPECLLSELCTLQDCRFKAVKNITVFEETLTANGLQKISIKADLMPALAKNSEDYALVYEFSTALKRASVAARKKIKELKGDLKKQYDEAKGKIEKDLDYVLKIIDPIIGQLADSRDYMESWTEALKENKALKLAAEQEKERTRVRLEKHRLINEETERQRVEAERIESERVKLERDRYEFECEKSRLSAGDAWDHGYGEITLESVSDPVTAEDLQIASDEIEEKATDEPGPKVMVIGSGDERQAVIAAIKNQSHGVIIASEKETEEIIEQINQPFIYSTDPAEKELQLLEVDQGKIEIIKAYIEPSIENIENLQNQGFESKTATTATRALTADITAASAKFSEAVEPPVTESDIPF